MGNKGGIVSARDFMPYVYPFSVVVFSYVSVVLYLIWSITKQAHYRYLSVIFVLSALSMFVLSLSSMDIISLDEFRRWIVGNRAVTAFFGVVMAVSVTAYYRRLRRPAGAHE